MSGLEATGGVRLEREGGCRGACPHVASAVFKRSRPLEMRVEDIPKWGISNK